MCEALSGFGVRRTPKTRKVWFFVRRVIGGKDHRVTIGSHSELSVSEARRLAKLRIVELEQAAVGRRRLAPSPLLQASPMLDPRIDELLALLRAREPVVESKPVLTLGELWESLGPGWLARVKPATQRNIQTLFSSRILPKWSATPVDQIKPANVAEWYHSFLATAPQYGASATQKLIYLLKLGHEQGLVESLPNFRIRYQAAKRRQPMERDAICKLVEALEGILKEDRYHSNANAIIAIMNTGERARAGAQLHTREVNYREMCITKERKMGQIKKIPMSDYTAKFLKSIHPKNGGYYFPNKRDPSEPIKYGALALFLKNLCSKHGVRARDGKIPTIHCMRHTYATLLEERGLPVSHIQRLLGHTSMQSTLRYIHGSASAAREGANRLEVTRVRVKS